MRVLLDTHVWLWMIAEPERLSAEATTVLEESDNELLLSAASSHEIVIKHSLGKLHLPDNPSRYVPKQIERTGVTPIPIEHGHALAVSRLPQHHRDPFDRLLVAVAILENVPIMTADRQLTAYDVAVRWASPGNGREPFDAARRGE